MPVMFAWIPSLRRDVGPWPLKYEMPLVGAASHANPISQHVLRPEEESLSLAELAKRYAPPSHVGQVLLPGES